MIAASSIFTENVRLPTHQQSDSRLADQARERRLTPFAFHWLAEFYQLLDMVEHTRNVASRPERVKQVSEMCFYVAPEKSRWLQWLAKMTYIDSVAEASTIADDGRDVLRMVIAPKPEPYRFVGSPGLLGASGVQMQVLDFRERRRVLQARRRMDGAVFPAVELRSRLSPLGRFAELCTGPQSPKTDCPARPAHAAQKRKPSRLSKQL